MNVYKAKYVNGDFFPDGQGQIFALEEVLFSSEEEAIKYLREEHQLSEEEAKTLQEEKEVERESDEWDFDLEIFSVSEERIYSSAAEVENSTTE